MLTTKGCICLHGDSYGDGNGGGDGDTFGDGYGYGNGSGHGDGNGYGNGYGFRYGLKGCGKGDPHPTNKLSAKAVPEDLACTRLLSDAYSDINFYICQLQLMRGGG